MTALLDPLTDAYLLEMAQHFAALGSAVPRAGPRRWSMPPPLRRGEQLVKVGDACAPDPFLQQLSR
ncbi:hypothetical protein [uncultured Hydrogenophaga sp.]|uniref:hypothetical protein n=1 Tax=uncultured Hydrogenophaga sp. TaxID=199683 RepID=UPI003748F333